MVISESRIEFLNKNKNKDTFLIESSLLNNVCSISLYIFMEKFSAKDDFPFPEFIQLNSKNQNIANNHIANCFLPSKIQN